MVKVDVGYPNTYQVTKGTVFERWKVKSRILLIIVFLFFFFSSTPRYPIVLACVGANLEMLSNVLHGLVCGKMR